MMSGFIYKLSLVKLKLMGVLICVMVAITAQFLAEHYNAPAMLMALLLGIALHFLSEEGKSVAGIEFSSTHILRLGVALLGARVSFELLIELGGALIGLVVLGVVLTLCFGLLLGRLFKVDWRFAFLTGGAVAICGASAAMAIAAILPKNGEKADSAERNLIFTVLSVTILSTMAMVLYPLIIEFLGLDTRQGGVFLGGTIHDVAQVVGAGFSVSDETGEVATLVKLIRVTMLAPVVLVASLLIRSQKSTSITGKRPPILPIFIVGFLALAALNSFGFIAVELTSVINNISRWALLVAIAAVGMKTSIKKMLSVGGLAIGLVVAETLFLAGFILLGMFYWVA